MALWTHEDGFNRSAIMAHAHWTLRQEIAVWAASGQTTDYRAAFKRSLRRSWLMARDAQKYAPPVPRTEAERIEREIATLECKETMARDDFDRVASLQSELRRAA